MNRTSLGQHLSESSYEPAKGPPYKAETGLGVRTANSPATIPCRACSGTGRVEMENPYARLSCGAAWVIRKCPECEGNGSFDIDIDDEDAVEAA